LVNIRAHERPTICILNQQLVRIPPVAKSLEGFNYPMVPCEESSSHCPTPFFREDCVHRHGCGWSGAAVKEFDGVFVGEGCVV
jgi:hypothetical protein